MKSFTYYSWFSLLIFLMFAACSQDESSTPDTSLNSQIEITLNPTGYAPLSALLLVETTAQVAVKITVLGQDGEASNVEKEFTLLSDSHSLPVLGLYANFNNTVEVNLLSPEGTVLETQTLSVQTQPLLTDFPEIEIDSANPAQMTPGFNLVNYFGYGNEPFPQKPFIFDPFGKIRWYLDYSNSPTLGNLFYDNGLYPLSNGNLIFGDGTTDQLYEVDMLGNVARSYTLAGYGFHHQVVEKPNGNLLVTVSDFAKPTIEDVIIEIDRSSGALVNVWDLTLSLDTERRTWETDLANLEIDWFHANGLIYDESDHSIIVSGRTQGTVKLTENNEVVWILAPHRDWAISGNGLDLNQFLLEPLNAQGIPFNDPQLSLGWYNNIDFQWAWYQHSPFLKPNGNLLLFDNGENRNYTGVGSYSRAVEYDIDDNNRTIQQVWDYGDSNGGATYSRIVSRVEHHQAYNNVLFTPGAVQNGGPDYGKVIEINQDTDEVVFEATIYPPLSFFTITFHNVQRIELYR